MLKLYQLTENNEGLSALISVIIIGAVALLIVRSAALTGFDTIESAYALAQGNSAYALARGCAEDALRRIQSDGTAAADNAALDFANGHCIENISWSDHDFIVAVSANHEDFYRVFKLAGSFDDGEIINISQISGE